MISYGSELYGVVKTLHVISVITWMAGLFYLPRLFVYHAQEPVGSATSERFKIMERRLLNGIMHPSLIVVGLTGPLIVGDWITLGWMHIKLLMVVGLIFMHFLYAKWYKEFSEDRNKRSHVFYRYANEVPTVLMLVIVPLVVLNTP